MGKGLTEREIEGIKALARRLREEMGAVDVRIYGSAARGTMDDESDIDLLVVLPGGDWQTTIRVCDYTFESSMEIDRFVCPLVLTVEEMSDPVMKASPLMKAASQEGTVI